MHSVMYFSHFTVTYNTYSCLTIRLRGRDFYEVMVDEGEA